jgi:hypothetical protein
MSTLRTNALEGVDAKNSITIVAGAGNITTTNVQEGSVKIWASVKGTTTTEFLDSFNCSGLNDDATGKTTVSFTNTMTDDNYSTTTSAQENTMVHAHTSVAAGSIQLQSRGSDDQAFGDVDHYGAQICGDLA